ncbi:hypothetical protein NFI96_006433 [Prochilodus magdalenae]|nr:hypothetical protein NFI96_006433 [Prochilodus magdalenae]
MIHPPHHTCAVVVLWGSCPLKNRVIQYTEKQMDYSLDLYIYRVSYTISGSDKMDTPPMFLPISSTPQPERRQPAQRRHSIEKETPTNVRQFVPPSRQSSKSLEEFCFPVECLALTVEEVMHIRQVLVKAELEKFQQYKDIYNALKKGKLCFCCRTKKFSFFTWSYTCQFCKRPVCSQCCKKIRLPSKPYGSLPIYSLGPSTSTMSRDKPEKGSTSHHRPSLHRTMSRLSKTSRQSSSSASRDEVDLPRELTEDWSSMEVCVDCKKFISDIISSSKHSLSLATKRARLKRKTQSFVMSSTKGAEYRPSERTINEDIHFSSYWLYVCSVSHDDPWFPSPPLQRTSEPPHTKPALDHSVLCITTEEPVESLFTEYLD